MRLLRKHRWLFGVGCTLLLLATLFTTGFLLVHKSETQASSSCSVWYRCPVTLRYGHNQEHGVDLATHYLSITALLPGKVTAVYLEHWETPNPMVITWQLTKPVCYQTRCAKYMYVQIRNSLVRKGDIIKAGQKLGGSYSFIELGFNNYPAYGHTGYPWVYSGIDPLKIWPSL